MQAADVFALPFSGLGFELNRLRAAARRMLLRGRRPPAAPSRHSLPSDPPPLPYGFDLHVLLSRETQGG